MPLSLFALALYVFLQSSAALGWIAAAPKFTAYVGMLFVVVVVFDAAFWARTNHPTWFTRRSTPPTPNQ